MPVKFVPLLTGAEAEAILTSERASLAVNIVMADKPFPRELSPASIEDVIMLTRALLSITNALNARLKLY